MTFDIIPKHDLYLISFEVKHDRLCRFTGNFFIEFTNSNGNNSGISITEPHYHILVVDDVCYLISTRQLMKLIK